MRTLESGLQSVRAAIKAGAPNLIVLFHDINNTTALSIGSYIDTIKAAVVAAGRAPAFTASTKAAWIFSLPPRSDRQGEKRQAE
jgi:hypothetical protein